MSDLAQIQPDRTDGQKWRNYAEAVPDMTYRFSFAANLADFQAFGHGKQDCGKLAYRTALSKLVGAECSMEVV